MAVQEVKPAIKEAPVQEESFIPGMPWKSKDDAVKGVTELKSFADRQGNEIGMLRKQLEMTQQFVDKLSQSQKAQAAPQNQGPDYDAEIANIYKQIETLDPMADDYQKQVVKLTAKSNELTARATHSKTLAAASELFKKELDERDIKAAHKEFYKNNPDFGTPEMQMRIREEIANDPTGMMDPLAAYLKIQRDTAAIEKQQIAEEFAEAKRLLALKKGTDETGKVITKGQSAQAQQTKQPKATGADLDKGMKEALQRYREKAG